MQDLLTASFEFVAISFALVLVFDFISGLQLPVTPVLPQGELEAAPQEEIAPNPKPTLALPTQPQVVPGWDVVEPAGPEPATLSWIEQNMPPTEVWSAEMPDAIALCKARQPEVRPVVTLASQQQLVSAGIRKCKKLASYHQIRRYNTMRLIELATALRGLVTTAELVA